MINGDDADNEMRNPAVLKNQIIDYLNNLKTFIIAVKQCSYNNGIDICGNIAYFLFNRGFRCIKGSCDCLQEFQNSIEFVFLQ